MNARRLLCTAMLVALAACDRAPTSTDAGDNRAGAGTNQAMPPSQPPAADDRQPVPAPPASDEGPAPGTSGGLPDDRTPLEEPNGPIDPKSAEGAGQVVQLYGGLLEQRRFADARKQWADGGRASGLTEAQFVAAYDKYAVIHSEVGKPAGMEGAAGSSYIAVPFHLFGTLKSGGRFNLVGPLTLRRVNDVPGSTQAQLRWHIQQSGLKPRP